MPDPNPWVDDPKDSPYECLGLPASASDDEAVSKGQELLVKYQGEMKQWKGDDQQQYEKYKTAYKNVNKASQAIEDNTTSTPDPDPELSIECPTGSVATGSDARFVVRDEDGERLSGVSVEHDGRRRRTDGDGETTLSFRSPGQATVTASKGGFRDATTTVKVVDRVVLDLAVIDSQPTVGDLDFKVTDAGGSGVRGAEVTARGHGSDQTDGRGRATLSFDETGEVTVTATKSGGSTEYVDAKTTVDVGKRTQSLDLTVRTPNPKAGDEVEFEVTADGTPVKGARVETNDDESDTTDANGIAVFTVGTGKTRVSADKRDEEETTYRGDTATIRAEQETVDLSLQLHGNSVAMSPTRIKVVDGNAAGVAGATVESKSGHADTTDSDGWVEFTFEEAGQISLRATNDEQYVDYDTGYLDIDVDEPERTIEIVDYPKALGTNERGEFTVIEETSEDPVQGAVLVASNGEKRVTDGQGKATFEFSRPQIVTVTAGVEDNSIEDTCEVRLNVSR